MMKEQIDLEVAFSESDQSPLPSTATYSFKMNKLLRAVFGGVLFLGGVFVLVNCNNAKVTLPGTVSETPVPLHEAIVITTRRELNDVISDSGVQVWQTTETRDLVTNQRSRPMNSTRGVMFEFDPSTSFSDSIYFRKDNDKAIVWDPNIINSQLDDVYLNRDNPLWPCIVQSTFNEELTEVVTVTVNYETTKGQELVAAIANKRSELMKSPNYQVGSPIFDTTGSHRIYKNTFNLDTNVDEGTSSRYVGYSWYISNTTGFYSKDVSILFDDPGNDEYSVFHYENDLGKVAIQKEYIEIINQYRKRIREIVVFETFHSVQLLENLEFGLDDDRDNGGDGDLPSICTDFGAPCTMNGDCCSNRCFVNQCQKQLGQGAKGSVGNSDRGGANGQAKAGGGVVNPPINVGGGGGGRRVRGVRGM